MPKVCPIAASSSNAMISKFCIGMKCAWYCEFARDCSIPLLAGMFADSEICRNVFNEPPKNDNHELIGGTDNG